jgi:hypothetical protein
MSIVGEFPPTALNRKGFYEFFRTPVFYYRGVAKKLPEIALLLCG